MPLVFISSVEKYINCVNIHIAAPYLSRMGNTTVGIYAFLF